MRRAVTLLEVLVVFAIMALLLGLLVSGIVHIRAAAASLQCRNHLRQWALAMRQHHDVRGALPPGAVRVPRAAWPVFLFPYVEQDALAARYRHDLGFHQFPNNSPLMEDAPVMARIAQALCPADVESVYVESDWQRRRRGNYAVCWGPLTDPLPPNARVELAPFGWVDPTRTYDATPRRVRLTDFRDGVSHTLALSEQIAARDGSQDWRGDWLNDEGGTWFSTLVPPNDAGPDWIWGNAYCQPEPRLTCVYSPWGRYAARSRHRGGVNVANMDGSARFVADDVGLTVWRGMGTINGNEVQ